MKAAIRSDCNQFIALTYLSEFLFPPDLTTWLHTQVIVVLLLLGEWLDTWNKPRKMQENQNLKFGWLGRGKSQKL
jgi:hypothetical protein